MKNLALTQEEFDAIPQLHNMTRFAVRNVEGRQVAKYAPDQRKYLVLTSSASSVERGWQSHYVFRGRYEGSSDEQRVRVPYQAYEAYQACVTRSPRATWYALMRYPGAGGWDCEALYD